MRFRTLQRWRRYFGIRASKLDIRPRMFGYAQVIIGAAGALLLVFLGYGINLATRSPEEQNVAALREQVEQLATRLQENGSALTSLEMTRSAKQELEEELRNVSGDLAVAKDDLAYFLRLVPAGTREGEVHLDRLSIRSVSSAENEYRFSVLVGYHAGRQTVGFTGRLQFLLTVERDGNPVQISWPDNREAGSQTNFQVQTYQWARKEGVIRLPSGDILKRAELVLLQGNTQRATTSITF